VKSVNRRNLPAAYFYLVPGVKLLHIRANNRVNGFLISIQNTGCSMNYLNLHDDLLQKATSGYWGYTSSTLERHHVVPSSMGGRDVPSNWCYVPVEVHYLLHLIPVKQGQIDQVFSVELIARRMRKRLPRWVRRLLNRRQQQLYHAANRERLARC
jgi:hypothetical protein